MVLLTKTARKPYMRLLDRFNLMLCGVYHYGWMISGLQADIDAMSLYVQRKQQVGNNAPLGSTTVA